MNSLSHEIVTNIATAEPVQILLHNIDPNAETTGDQQHIEALRLIYDHSFETAIYTAEVSRHLQLAPEIYEGLILGALVHDVGKASVPASVLCKAGLLTVDEKAMMSQHSAKGAEYIANVASKDLESRHSLFSAQQWDLAVALAALHHTFKTHTAAHYPIFRGLRELH